MLQPQDGLKNEREWSQLLILPVSKLVDPLSGTRKLVGNLVPPKGMLDHSERVQDTVKFIKIGRYKSRRKNSSLGSYSLFNAMTRLTFRCNKHDYPATTIKPII